MDYLKSKYGYPNCSVSKGELGVVKYLDKNNIQYIREYNSWYGYAGIVKCKIFVYRELIKHGKNRVNYKIRFRNNKFTVE